MALNALLKVALVASLSRFLRPRWKRVAGCVVAISVALYLHADFLEYARAARDSTVTDDWLLAAFVAKYMIISGAVLAFVILELRDRHPDGARTATPHRPPQASSAGAAPSENDASPSPATNGDGFDFLRGRRELETRTEKLIRSKPSK